MKLTDDFVKPTKVLRLKCFQPAASNTRTVKVTDNPEDQKVGVEQKPLHTFSRARKVPSSAFRRTTRNSLIGSRDF
ncbi:hypothetical protein EV655_107133 [Rhodovulum euryhalinum]|uniref:Uncharacterized protein n=1 Tax=Rhodovulum euryhalinum TaxID=35805 RepID=A0A4V2SAD5_9RHOB|nr:hypothetical protein EV655_107133 [Rhodovulum euryhalinum]